ncbi:Predicted DNA-binding transcriptional regulator YafY, contains an HTH and WYL domains [Glycomyces harbinensis]|uniref:Predicted DNA-binding transcriptional regulator YafY, contains an HTH and WYL domains n=1 Tax=Glycomyces harbinensis TaxID=58114 RepID=A0A1G6QZI8_9ACTN|nr:Predicted DNA-binding transcriptional regulator YafY, contains an HTH and WYL domains [Glycomyces harbinensis]
MLTLLSLLQTRRDWPGGLLAERLAVSERTVRRDVDRLRGLGYRVSAVKGPYGGYRLEAGSDLPPLLFDDEQAVALAIALRTAAGAGIEESAARALATVRQVLPARLRRRVDAVQVGAVPQGDPVDAAVIAELGAAVQAREEVGFRYGVKEERRRAQPHHVLVRQGRWYLVAWDLDREDWRVFRVDRMALRTPNGPRFTPREVPGGDVHAFVRARFKGSDGPDAWPCTGSVVLAAPAGAVAPFAGEGTVEDLGPGRCRLTTGAWSWPAVAASVARFDADIEAARPVELVAAFARLAGRFAAVGDSQRSAEGPERFRA